MDVDQYDFSADMGLYLSGDYNFQSEGKDEVDGAAAYKYTGTVTGDKMKELMLFFRRSGFCEPAWHGYQPG